MDFTIPVQEHGPYDLPGLVVGIDAPATMIGCDASVTVPVEEGGHGGHLGGYAVWATVAGDGRAQYGWYEAIATINDIAELNAIRHALSRYPCGADAPAEITVITDSYAAGALAVRLSRGEPYDQCVKRPNLYSPLLDAARQEGTSRRFRVDCQPGDNGPHLSGNRLAATAHRVAWGVCRLLADGIPLDDAAHSFLLALANMSLGKKGWYRFVYWAWRETREPGSQLGPDTSKCRRGQVEKFMPRFSSPSE
ncbi:hypothetical protein AB0F17_62420 [Nonomuraea sp. NPDC026600]|uniref:hypothetical protein n=1 Tax=Nonomuraea sp. NPDC026600 TaxID=3155363 RepID=UPI0033D07ED7